MIARVLVERLKALDIDPVAGLGLLPSDIDQRWDEVEPQATFRRDDGIHRDWEYDIARIKFFKDQFESKAKVDPIEIYELFEADDDEHSRPWALALGDGHHRLAGAYLAGVSTVQIDFFDGLPSTLDWLRGKGAPPNYFFDPLDEAACL